MISLFSGPVIGGIIGWVTNYLALKMLFRPRKAIVIRGHTLPFTPGIIPKRKNQLAGVLGQTIAERFFTSKELEEIFLSDEMCEHAAENIVQMVVASTRTRSIEALVRPAIGEEKWESTLNAVTSEIFCQMQKSLESTDVTQTVALEVGKVLKEKMDGTFLNRILKDDLLAFISVAIGEQVEEYVKGTGGSQIYVMIESQVRQMADVPLEQLAGNLSLDEGVLKAAVAKGFREYMKEHIQGILKMFDIAAITERKVVELPPEEIEDMVYTVIDREMKSVIWLGGLLGVLIGTVNIFI